MTALYASDLDRTLIYSARAFWLETPDDEAPPIVVAEVYQGAPLSFLTREAERLLLDLRSRATFVPVTTRTVAQYRRVRLAGPTPEWAVATNGGVLLHHGEPDADWSADLRRRTAETSAPLEVVRALLAAPRVASWVLRLHEAEGLFLYAIVDGEALDGAPRARVMPAGAAPAAPTPAGLVPAGPVPAAAGPAATPADQLAELTEACAHLGWRVSLQGRKLYCVPVAVDKALAVAEVARRTAATTVVAAGDSLLDRPMLERADVALRPAHGELDDIAFTAPHLTVTRSRGLLAGEELLRLAGAALEEAADESTENRARGALPG